MSSDYWMEAGLLWAQIVKAVYRSKKVLTISDTGIDVGGMFHELHPGGIYTIELLGAVLDDSL